MSEIHPALILLAGGLLLFALPTTPRRIASACLPVLGFLNLLTIAEGTLWHITWGGYELTVLRADRLSMLFGYLFHLAAFLGAIYALHLKDRLQIGTGLIYAGSAVGAVFAGDLITLFIFWELLAITSVFLIWARGGERALRSGMRYLVMHISSGLLLLLGAVFYFLNTKSLAFEHIGLDKGYHYLIFLSFGIKCAFPLLHNWLIDAYPESTPVGTVFLSAFTTKTAVYALARGFAGEDLLIYIGATMTIFPVFFAVIENDLRRVLSYSMINQIGFMVVGIGIGGALGINGAVSHAFNDVIFKGLLFMSMGAVLYRTGRMNATDLGGLYKSMPWTCACCLIGAASISALPLFNAFISKPMVMQGVANMGAVGIWLVLLAASAGVLHHAGIKIPFFSFFAHDAGIRCPEAPLNMRIAMTISAILCVAIGSYPPLLYNLLPYPVDYISYTTTHVVLQLQLVFYGVLAFAFLMLTGRYPSEQPSVNLDVDWVYRRALPKGIRAIARTGGPLIDAFFNGGKALIRKLIAAIRTQHNNRGLFGRSWLSQSNVLIAIIFLAIYLIYYF
ncbi:MAG: Na(+)/H(+) antiporter subunit D [Candidatus Latescibacteria bacterium]|nr:Na(+)/H(+) antiporter subunit D [Candidatus Latescibacterota bacterium]MCY4351668.1 Na(+)/H(+) antiporter subunit D [Gemmatimonadota bacterium]